MAAVMLAMLKKLKGFRRLNIICAAIQCMYPEDCFLGGRLKARSRCSRQRTACWRRRLSKLTQRLLQYSAMNMALQIYRW